MQRTTRRQSDQADGDRVPRILQHHLRPNEALDPHTGKTSPDTGTGSGITEGKFLYWWVANPYDANVINDPASAYYHRPDFLAANWWWHMEKDPNNPYYDNTIEGRPGVDYLRRTSDRNAANIAICVDQSRQQTATSGGWFWMHGNGTNNPKKGWKNELMGDGHVEIRRPDQIVKRWASVAVGPAGW